MTKQITRPGVATVAVLAAVLAVGLFAVRADRPCPLSAAGGAVTAAAAAACPPSPTPLVTSGPEEVPMSAPADQSRIEAARAAVQKLVDEQKLEAAAAECARVRDEARAASDDALWAWALIRESQLRTALHGYETTVRFLKDQPWPASPLERAMLDLFYGQSLVVYCQAYSWEIAERERVEAKGEVDLESWTRDQIFAEAWQAFLRVWKDRDALASRQAADFPDLMAPGDYPSAVRGNLRDFLVHLMAGLLADTAFWTPAQSNEVWLVDLPQLLARAGKTGAADALSVLDSASAHPV